MLGRKEELNYLNKIYNSDYLEYLVMATHAFPNIEEKYLWLISKSGYSDSVVRQAKEDGAVILTVDDLFEF